MKFLRKIKDHFKNNKKYYHILWSNVLFGLCSALAFIFLTCIIVHYIGLDYDVIDEHIEILSSTTMWIMFASISVGLLFDIQKLCKENKEVKKND